MSSEKRLLLAVGLTLLILIVYPVYLRWITPESIPSRTSAAVQTPNGLGETAGVLAGPGSGLSLPQPPDISELPVREKKFYEFSNSRFDVQFSDRGAVMTKLQVKGWDKNGNGDVDLIHPAPQEAASVQPRSEVHEESTISKAFLVTIPNQGIDFSDLTFSLEALSERTGEVRLAAQEAGRWRLEKKFQFDEKEPVVWFETVAQNLSDRPQLAALEVTSDLNIDSASRRDNYEVQSFTAFPDRLVSVKLDKMAKKTVISEGSVLWQALVRKYFGIFFHPDEPATLSKSEADSKDANVMRGTLRFSAREVAPGETLTRKFLVYAGPQNYAALKSFDRGFERVLSQGFFGVFKLWLLVALRWVHKVTGNYGWSIILITCAVKLLFTPFTHMSFESMRKMQALQPKIKALQEQYKQDQAKLSKETMELYKRHKVNPMGGCLPMLLQIPVFIAFYQVLVQTVELKGAPFLFWIRDLSEPDRLWALPFSLPFLGDGVNVLPILMLLSMVWQQRLTPQAGTPEQQKIMMIMPVVFGFIFYSLPSGLVLYWLFNKVPSLFFPFFF